MAPASHQLQEKSTSIAQDAVLVIGSAKRFMVNSPRELWHYRDLLASFSLRDLKLRYRQTALGVLWVLLQPLAAAGLLSFVFGRVAKLSSDGVPYFLFAYVGFLAWNLVSSTLSRVVPCMLNNGGLLSKVYFPRLLLPVSTSLSGLVDFIVAFTLGLALLASQGFSPSVVVLTLPLWLALLFTLAFGTALLLSGPAVHYRDVAYILPVFLQLGMYATPVAYSLSQVPAGVRTWYQINPLVSAVQGFRWSLLGGTPPTAGATIYSASVAIVLLVAGVLVFVRLERTLADVV